VAAMRLTIALTSGQQRQIKDATGKSLTELSIELSSTGHLAEKDLDQGAGGEIADYSF
jgi:hypothetical protein